MTDCLAAILAEPMPPREPGAPRTKTVTYRTPSEDGAYLVRRAPAVSGRNTDGRPFPLQRQLPARTIDSPYREVYDLAVAISEKTPTHNLCCTSTTPGEVPVTAD